MAATGRRRGLIAAGAVLVIVAAVAAVALRHKPHPASSLTIFGNTDIREVQLAFDDAGRIVSIAVQEGDRVRKGMLLASLDPARFQDHVAQAEGALAAARETLARLKAGTRPERITQAREEVAFARAEFVNAQITYHRERALARARYVSQQASDNAARAFEAARARWRQARAALQLALKGPRREDLAVARARVDLDRATLALARHALADTRLYAPAGGVIENRILEPGDLANPKTPVLTLARDKPIWARAYLPERALGWVHPGMTARIESDSFPDKMFSGWIGFISPRAEFTPKSVETAGLRTQLVYRVRVYACNSHHLLRLGMPVTVIIPTGKQAVTAHSHRCGH